MHAFKPLVYFTSFGHTTLGTVGKAVPTY